eukprot:362822-Chlamydomonas_euryale.AAC.28
MHLNLQVCQLTPPPRPGGALCVLWRTQPGLTSASEQEVELEIFEGLWTPRRLVTREAKAILTAGGAIVVAFQV